MSKTDGTTKGPVGYKSAPTETRWKKGESGNPGGRRKKPPSVYDGVVIAVVEATNASGEKTVLEGLFTTLARSGLQGDTKATCVVLKEYKEAKGREKHNTNELDLDAQAARRILGDAYNIFDEPPVGEKDANPSAEGGDDG